MGGSGEAWGSPDPWSGPGGRPGPGATPGEPAGAEGPVHGTSAQGGPYGTSAQGPPYGASAQGAPYTGDGPPAQGAPWFPDGTFAHGGAHWSHGTSAQDVPWPPGEAPAYGVPGFAGEAPARGVPGPSGGTPAHGAPEVRGGHPEQREAGGGWGHWGTDGAAVREPEAAGPGGSNGIGAFEGARAPVPRQRQSPPAGPRQEYVDAFDQDDVLMPHSRAGAPSARPVTVSPVPSAGRSAGTARQSADEAVRGTGAAGTGSKGRTYTGIAAAAVTTVLAVVVAGQVADDHSGADVRTQSVTGRGAAGVASVDGKPAAPPPGERVLTYEQKMDLKYELAPALEGSGTFETVPGSAKGSGKGRKYTYRVDVEEGLGLDSELFAEAVHRTLNDDRSWAHGGRRTFERVSSGRPDFVVTLASPGTTAVWCARSGLDTTEENVSCDSAATERVMINAYRWAQGSDTYGDKIHAYRQMLINHEIGHRLGYGHATCNRDGALAPVMQQQTKFLDHDGIRCLPNPWPYPES